MIEINGLTVRLLRKNSFRGLTVPQRLEAAADLAPLAARVKLVPFPVVPNSWAVPPGLALLVPLYPALKRGAKLGCPSGA